MQTYMTEVKIINVIQSAKAYFSSFDLSAPDRISLCKKKKIQTNKPNFIFKNTHFSSKLQQKPGKNTS